MVTRYDSNKEEKEITRILSMYQTLRIPQINALFPGNEVQIQNLIRRNLRERRFFLIDSDIIAFRQDISINWTNIRAFWVLLSFVEQVEFHSKGDFPVCISFLAEGELFDIIVADRSQISLINHAYFLMSEERFASRKLVVVDDLEYIQAFDIPGVRAFCMVDNEDGMVQFYREGYDVQ